MGKSSAPPLAAVFRSQLQGEVLARVLLSPGEWTPSSLAKDLGAPFATVLNEVNRLVAAGVVTDQRSGRNRLLLPNTDSVAFTPLRDLVMVTFGPRQVVAEEFAELSGVEMVAIFGSWAARYFGEPGPEPGDIDVLVVGSAERAEVYDAADRAVRRLHREVNPTLVPAARWKAASEPFLREVKSRPLAVVLGEEQQ